jgi:predicted SprT family Zn-dependent metalloprotease
MCFAGQLFDEYRNMMRKLGPLSPLTDEQAVSTLLSVLHLCLLQMMGNYDWTMQEWAKMQKYLLRFWPRRPIPLPQNAVRAHAYSFVCLFDDKTTVRSSQHEELKDKASRARCFHAIIVASIVAQFVALSMQHFGQSEAWDQVRDRAYNSI